MDTEYFGKKSIILGKWLCIGCISLPILNFIGRFLHLGIITRFHEELPQMTPNISFVLIAFAIAILLLLNQKKIKLKKLIPFFSAFSILMGLATIVEYVFHVELGIDNIGRPSFLASLNACLLGISIILVFKNKGKNLFQYLNLFILSVCLVVITGYLFSTKNFHGFPIYPGAVPMALNTAIAFILLSIALLCVNPEKGFMNLLTSKTQSGHFARGMSLAILTVPPTLGLITRLANVAGIIDLTMQISLFMLMLISFWFFITWRLTRKGEEREKEILFLSEKLKLSEEKMKLTLAKASDGIFTADHNGNYIDVNEAGCRLLGLSRKEIIGKNIRHFIPPSEIPKLEEKLQAVRTTDHVPLSEWNMKTYTGEYVPVEVSDTVLKDGRWIGIVRDIRERIQARKNLQNSEQKFRGLLEAAQDAVLIVNSVGKIIFVNQQTLNWFGFTEKELYQQTIEILIPDRFRKKHIAQRNGFLENPIARPMGRDIELFGKRKDGSEFPVEVALSPSESAEGRIVTAVIRDISETKKREEETKFLAEIGKKLFQSLDLETILNLSAEMIVPALADCCVVRSKEENGRFKAKKIIHRDPSEMKKLKEYERMVENSEEVQSTLDQMILKGQSFVSFGGIRTDLLHLNPEINQIISDLRIHSFIVVPLIPKNTVVGTISFILTDPMRSFELSDITFFEGIGQRISLSLENAKLYKDATQAVKIREEVLSIVSHDLKNPLTFITLKTQLLGRMKNCTEEKIIEFTKGISKATNQMQHLINDLLDFAKLESGTLRIDITQTNIQNLVSPLIEIFTSQASEKDITFNLNIHPEVHEISCDENRIRQVLGNLLGNAIKFTQQGGSVSLDVKKDNSEILFIVSDNGPGISPDHLDKIFDRFWQPEETKKQGSGLGLSICKSIVHAHQGRIWAESIKGAGTKFFFTIPA